MNNVLKAFGITLLTAISVAAAAPNGNKLQCFSGTEDGPQTYDNGATYYVYGGTCAIQSGGCAYLDTTSDADVTPTGDQIFGGNYAGVYVSPGLPGKPIADVTKLSFSYTLDGGAVAGGSPRLSIPIDENGDGLTDAYAFIDAANCNQLGQTSGTVDLSCPVFYNSPYDQNPDGTLYANWADFAAANPTYRIGKDALAFVIVDQPFKGTICDVQLGKAPAKSR